MISTIRNLFLKPITQRQVEMNSSSWVIYKNRVYDITPLLKTHPGGNIITCFTGTDVTEIMETIHHPWSRSKMSQYCIGKLSE